MSKPIRSKNIGGYAIETNDDGQIIAIWNYNGTDVNGNTITRENPIPVNPKSKLFEDLKNSEDVMKVWNFTKYEENTDAYADNDRAGVGMK